MPGLPTMRAFCALNLDVASVRRLEGVAAALRADPRCPPARWVPATRLHVTLQFFGDIDVGLGTALSDAVAPVAADGAISVRFARLSAYPDEDRGRVVVVLLDDEAGEVRRLADRVREATRPLGLDPEAAREYLPHVTLARLDRPGDVRPWLSAASLPVERAVATELVVYRSDATPAGHEYVALARFGLRPPR